jgi:hypothetical protein
MPDDPCINTLATTAVTATGATSVSSPKPTAPATFACFYVYSTVSAEPSVNAGLQRGKAEITSAEVQATPFSPVCQVYAPIYRQVTVADLQTHPDLNTARCEQSDGASRLNVSKATGPADHRPTVTENLGPAYGYHSWDLGLAQDNLVSDVAAAETTWTRDHR